jgi:Holliday junction DNA helicase RuvB
MNNFLKQSLTGLWKRDLHDSRFEKIVSHDDIKQIFTKAILSKRPVHLLLVGSPGSAKTMFLTQIKQPYKSSYFVVGSNTTKAGLVNQLFERRPKFLLIDELEKMSVTDQASLLHLMETGIISETKINKTRQMQLTSWVFATANSSEKIIQTLLSRFAILKIPEYTFEEFTEIALTRLARETIDKLMALSIAEKVWHVVTQQFNKFI